MKNVTAIIVAAGSGRRFGSPKQFALLRGRPVLAWSLDVFESHPRIGAIVVVLPDEKLGRDLKDGHKKITAVVTGGEQRQDSVFAGLLRVDPRRTAIVLVHDGARPLVTAEIIDRVIEGAEKKGAAVPVLALDDTVKEIKRGAVVRTLDRETLVRVQTPQGFALDLLQRALDRARADGFYGMDDAALVERLGAPVAAVRGEARNIKITSPGDIRSAEALLDD
ncbi:MAG: 2-C-methyl-D-erythritol 4-phosphate cytidylyltransferase [Candidatus Aminicenantes bacterium]|nr:2-C-methyl-D-erythritol 4-phosphate cytidylyltransferase [Candidatus Aminicenantes bacterium]